MFESSSTSCHIQLILLWQVDTKCLKVPKHENFLLAFFTLMNSSIVCIAMSLGD